MNTNTQPPTCIEHTLVVGRGLVEVVEVFISRAYGVERWGVGIGKGGKLLDYFEYARQRDVVTATYFPISPAAPGYNPMPGSIHALVMDMLRDVAIARYAVEREQL